MKSQVMIVSPEMAAVWLEKNTENRNVRITWVRELAALIERGEFKLTHQGIAFGKNGLLLDGQHRLMAIVEADKSVPLMVTRDAEEETFTALDIGARRSFSDMYGVDMISAAVSRFIAQILYSKPSPLQQAKVHKIVSPVLEDLRQFCPTLKKGFTSSTVQSAACIRILAGEDAEYIKLIYWNIAHVAHSALPPIGRAFIDQMYGKAAKTRGGERYDLLARALKVFDKQSKDINRLVVGSNGASLDFVRETMSPLLAPEKKPTTKTSASTRAKSAKLSHLRTA